jgi:hypothetical protein
MAVVVDHPDRHARTFAEMRPPVKLRSDHFGEEEPGSKT